MGVSSLTNRVVYNGDGTSTSFAFPYYFFKTSDFLVYVYDTILGGSVLKTLGTDYTVTGTANFQGLYPNGGNIVFGTAPINTQQIVIVRSPQDLQNYALQQNGNISSAALVQQMDFMTLLIQRLTDQVSRCIQLPDGLAPTFSGLLPTNTSLLPSQFVQVNQNGNGFALGSTLSPVNEVVIPYTSAQTGSTTFTQTLFSIPAGSLLTYLVIKPTQAFAGTSISAVSAKIGITGTAGLFIPAFDVLQAVSPTVYDSVVANYIGSFSAATPITLTLTSTGANLANLTQGSLNIFYNYDTL